MASSGAGSNAAAVSASIAHEDSQASEELTAFVEQVLKQMVGCFDAVDEMGSRIGELEKSVNELVQETLPDEELASDATATATAKALLSARSRTHATATFSNQNSLPRLPIPTLAETAERYLNSCKPLLTEEELAKTTAAVKEFIKPGGYGEVLQARLHELDKVAPRFQNSWLEDIWLKKAYLEWRDPSMINVNWWCQFRDHPEHPEALVKTAPLRGQITKFQTDRAAGFVHRLLQYKVKLDREELAPEYMKDKPLCMNQYRNQFGVTRVPGRTCDEIHSTFPAKATHIIVLVRDQIYKVDVLSSKGEILPIPTISKTLEAIAADSLVSECQPAVGVLTAGHRDTWFEAYDHLMKEKTNVATFDTIKDALFAVCLDDSVVSFNVDDTHQQIFHNYNAHNRWFDKSIQLVVMPNGRAGVNGEHTPSDAVIPGNIMTDIVEGEKNPVPSGAAAVSVPFAKLKWQVDGKVQSLMQKAQKEAQALIDDTESVLLHTDVYGSQFLKEKAKASPDAFVQVAMQTTWARLHKVPTAVYESASTRLFKHGRTETGRSLTVDTWRFASNFDKADPSTLRDLFVAAIKSQSDYMRAATFGKGVDRHLLGLRTLIQEGEKDKATLFNDPAYIKSMYFKLSSSNMSPGSHFYGGFGPVVPEGYGINYAIGKTNLKFSISAKRSCEETKPPLFRDTLQKTLEDMGKFFK
ncbi:hypothetical protein HDU96_004873 [Phlyctochytrium bullatum]|nr:hypothetical protein HDU96_004873 [Phlyctochytrium bullatum]